MSAGFQGPMRLYSQTIARQKGLSRFGLDKMRESRVDRNVHSLASKRRKTNLIERMISSNSDFIPSEPPPAFAGTPVFKDIEFSRGTSKEAQQRNADPKAVFVVTGASRGIGCQYVKALLERTNGRIVACCRLPSTNDLKDYLDSNPHYQDRVTLTQLDLRNQDTIDKLANVIETDFEGRLDGLFNVAGLLGDGGSTTPGPERTASNLDRSWITTSFEVNTIGPMMMCQALMPYLKVPVRSDRPKSIVVNMSARVGSISDNGLGGWYSYRASKAALNQFTRTFALEVTKRNQTWVIALHPGTTNTGLSKPFQKNVKPGKLFPVEFTVNQLLNLVDTMEEHHSGGFYDWAGKALPF